ncbi:Homeodomain-like [Acididesulfobacillus acetoxydans]|uniref:Homeodomain-like n=1 Tax=Acididesulfobacillus acetoxydans TaxID=1561005 RepID=A0A8S0Y2Z7_9FIRM|nr:PucR family transcriptional regulator [Acididesulfobacillus acetoxydans]CAA7601405.1 Homeodomain-like [Acididesulfobacillus acetoxydans]CEJ08836.1 Transcriptional regulator, CdaR [Acididesulfobacillus acetoxydans]
MILTVREALDMEILRRARVVAGETGLDREITWVSVLEVLDEIQLLRAGELLVTTAFGLEQDPGLQEHLIPALAAKGLAALAIQTGFYIRDIPSVLRTQADTHALPLILLPQDLAFSALTQTILRRIIGRQMERLQYSERMNHEFTQVILANRGLPAVAQTLSQLIKRPVRIQNETGTVLAEHPEPGPISTQTGSQETASPQTALLKTVPVAVGNKVYGYISVLTRPQEGPPNSPALDNMDNIDAMDVIDSIDEMDEMAIRQAATVTALEILKEQAVLEAENRTRGDFLEDMLNGAFPSGEALERRARRLGYEPGHSFALIVLGIDSVTDEGAAPAYRETLLASVRPFFYHRGCRPIAKVRGETVVVFWQPSPREDPNQLQATLFALKETIKKALAGPTLSIASGGLYRDLSQVPQAYREAASSLTVNRALGRRDTLALYRDLGVYRLLLCAGRESQTAFYQETLAPLAAPGERGQKALLLTLETFLNFQGNIKQAAEQLGIHRQTLRHRLRKIEELTGLKPSDPEDRLKLQLGLKLRYILDVRLPKD